MFERELKDLQVVKRWGIVRRLSEQTVADHSFYVVMYANDICSFFARYVSRDLHLHVLQQALWHDMDETFSGDIPGPAKRAFGKENVKTKLKQWMDMVFGMRGHRDGSGVNSVDQNLVTAIIKAADYIDAYTEMLIEQSLGNYNAKIRVEKTHGEMWAEVEFMLNLMKPDVTAANKFRRALDDQCDRWIGGHAMGPEEIYN